MAARRRRWKWWVLGILAILLAAFAAWNYWPTDNRIVIGRDTTYIDGPLNADGTINYAAALDAMYSEGVTPQNNAAIPYLQALGPVVLPPPAREKTYRRLGMAPLAEDGNYLISWAQWVGSHPEAFGEANGAPMTKDAKYRAWDKVNTAATMPWREANEPALADWLRDNAVAMTLLGKASRLPRFYLGFIPTGEPGLATRDILFYPQKSIGDAFASRITMRTESNDIAGAWSDVLTLSRLGRLLSQDPASISMFAGQQFDAAAWKAGMKLLEKMPPDSRKTTGMLAEVRTLPPFPEFADIVDRGERFFVLDAVTCLYKAAGSMGGGVPQVLKGGEVGRVDWNQVLREVNQHYNKEVGALRLPTAVERASRASTLRGESNEIWRMAKEDQKRMRLLVYRLGGQLTQRQRTRVFSAAVRTLCFGGFWNKQNELNHDRVWFDFFKVACALSAYKADKGEFPNSLSDLLPTYMKTVPTDRFSDNPLIYKPKGKGYILYSVGRNMKDDGGVEDRRTGADDIAVEVGTGGD